MFRPTTASISVEPVLESEADGWTFEDDTRQAIYSSSLRLIPLTGAVLPTDLAWPKISWTEEDELISLPGDISSRWSVSFNNQPVVSPQTFEFEPLSKYLDIETEAGEYQILRQNTNGQTWHDEVSNADGWVIQTRLQVLDDVTGDFGPHGHYLVLDDGVHRERLFFHQTGIYFENNPDLSIRTDLRSRPREIRIGAIEDDIYVLLDDGLGLAGLNGFTGDSTSKELAFGTTGSEDYYRSLFDYMHQHHGDIIIDAADTVHKVYSTDEVFCYSPSYHPQTVVQEWVAVQLEVSGTLSGGTTSATVQYKSSATSDWVDFSTTVIASIGWVEILIDNIPTEEDGSDEIRLKIGQVSNDGSAEPPRIETINIVASFVDEAIKLRPSWGHRSGNNTVMIDQTLQARTIMLDRFPDTGIYASLVPDLLEIGEIEDYSSPIDSWGLSFVPTAFGDLMDGWQPLDAGGDLSLSTRTMGIVDGENVLSITGQRVSSASVSGGIYFPDHTGSGLDFWLEVEQGEVIVAHGSDMFSFYRDDYWTPKRVRLSLTGSDDLYMIGGGDSIWTVGNFGSYYRTPDSTALETVPSESGDGGAASVRYTPHEFVGSGSIMSTPGWELGLVDGGLPYVDLGADGLTGDWGVLYGEERDIAWNFRRFSDHNRIQLLIDGEICGEKITSITGVAGGLLTLDGGVVGSARNVRVYSASLDARDYSRDNGFSEPVFQVDAGVPPESENKLIFRFYESGGALADDSGNDYHARSDIDQRLNIRRDAKIYDEFAASFWGPKAQLKILHCDDLEPTLPLTVYAQGVFYTGPTDGVLYKKVNAGGTVGLIVEITTDGTVKVTVAEGSVTSTRVIADGQYRYLAVVVTSAGITIRIDDEDETAALAIGSMAAADQDAEIGPNLYCYLREFVLRHGDLDRDTFDSWNDWSDVKWTPTDRVIVAGEEVAPERIRHYSPWRKFISMPEGTPGYASVYVDTNGQILPAKRPYKYTYGYTRKIPQSRIEKAVGSTLSPFRVLTSVPDGSINLAYIQGSDISVPKNVSHIDLSYGAAENVSVYAGGEFLLTGQVEGDGSISYTGQLDTPDMVITNRAVANRDFAQPSPGYYKYLVGRKRRYVYQPDAVSVSDIDLIRKGIRLVDASGKEVKMSDYAWDIEVSDVDFFGNPLPTNVFAVMLITNKPYIPENTISVVYHAADSLHEWTTSPNFIEIVNTSPIFTPALSDVLEDEQYVVAIEQDGTYNLQLGITGL
jgi:hypothetical protein